MKDGIWRKRQNWFTIQFWAAISIVYGQLHSISYDIVGVRIMYPDYHNITLQFVQFGCWTGIIISSTISKSDFIMSRGHCMGLVFLSDSWRDGIAYRMFTLLSVHMTSIPKWWHCWRWKFRGRGQKLWVVLLMSSCCNDRCSSLHSMAHLCFQLSTGQ